MSSASRPHALVVGGGFAGLYAARSLGGAPLDITLIDRRNFHLFQPLLYQVATGGLSPGDIASPLRAILKRHRNVRVLQAEVVDIAPEQRQIHLADGRLDYDFLLIATGAQHHYFGRDDWAEPAPGLKTIEDALDIRSRILNAFEQAENEPDPQKRQTWLRFVVVGAGPTGVELAGALAELAHNTLRQDFSRFDPRQSEIHLLEAADQVLPPYVPSLGTKAANALKKLGVQVHTGALVKEITSEQIHFEQDGRGHVLAARTALWAAGMQVSPLGRLLAERTQTPTDRAGRLHVGPDLSLPNHPEIFVLGDLAHFDHGLQRPLPGVAPVAMQQGRYAAQLIRRRLKGKNTNPFCYRDKGSLAVIGRNAAVADMGFIRFSGFPAWLAWALIHIAYLIEFDNKVLVLFQWAVDYFTRKRGARLITPPAKAPKNNREH